MQGKALGLANRQHAIVGTPYYDIGFVLAIGYPDPPRSAIIQGSARTYPGTNQNAQTTLYD